MPKKPRKQILYTRQSSQDLVSAFGFILLFFGGQGFWSGGIYIISLILYCLAGAVVFSIITDVRKLYILDDTLYAEHLLSTDSFHVSMLDKVEEILILGSGNRGIYKLIPALAIKVKNGKTIHITPLEEIDIERILLAWQNKYQESRDEKVITNE